MRILIFILLLISLSANSQVGNINFLFKESGAAPPPASGFNWANLTPQAPTSYNNCGTVVVENKSFTNLNVGVNNGNDVYITGSCNITFRNCYFGPSIRKGASVEFMTGTTRFVSCLFASNEGGVEGADCTGDVQIDSCEFINPWGQGHCKGQAVQFAYVTGDGSYVKNSRMENFRGEGSTEDWISMFTTNGTPGSYVYISGNHARGGGFSNSGGGFIAGDGNGSYIIIENNKLFNPGNYILAAAGGDHIIIRNNMGYEAPEPIRNIAMYAYLTNASDHCNTITMTGNSMLMPGSNNYYCYCTPTCGDVVGIDESQGDPTTGWLFSNSNSLTLAQLAFPATMITFVDADRLWHIRDESVQFQSEWTSGGCYDGDATYPRPTSNAGANQNISISTATLNGNSSTSTNGRNFKWVQVSGPNTAVMSNQFAGINNLSGLTTGTYEFRLECVDNSGAGDADWMTVSVILGTSYYISPTGNNANNGTSTSTPWQTISKVNSSTFSEGDQILFKRGGTWREQLTIPSSGTLANPITFGAYDAGAIPIINGANVTTGWTNAGSNRWWVNNPNATTTKAMVIIGGTIFAEVASVAEVNSASEYFIDVTASPDRLYVFSTVDPATLTAEISNRNYCIVTAAGASSKKYIEIEDIEVRYAGRAGIYFEGPGAGVSDALDGGSVVRDCVAYANREFGMAHVDHYDNVTFEDCTATYNGNGLYSWVADEGTFRRCSTSFQIHYEAISAFTDGGAIQSYQGTNWLVEECVSDNDYDAIHIDAGGVSTNAIIRYNKITNSRTGVPPTPGMGVGSVGAGATVQFYYNLIVNCASSAFESFTTMIGTVQFYNNTIFLADGYGTENGTFYLSVGNNFILKNNIFARMGADSKTLLTIAAPNMATSNYNQWYQGPLSAYRWFYNGSNYSTLALWRTGSGQDANSQSGDPLFVNQASDWTLQAGSPCVNAGVNLGFTRDFSGNPVGAQPDIGCFER